MPKVTLSGDGRADDDALKAGREGVVPILFGQDLALEGDRLGFELDDFLGHLLYCADFEVSGIPGASARTWLTTVPAPMHLRRDGKQAEAWVRAQLDTYLGVVATPWGLVI